MCKKLYKNIFYIIWLILPICCFADIPPSTPPVVMPQAGQVTISASQKQLTQINALFDQADYMHLANPYNVVTSLMLNE